MFSLPELDDKEIAELLGDDSETEELVVATKDLLTIQPIVKPSWAEEMEEPSVSPETSSRSKRKERRRSWIVSHRKVMKAKKAARKGKTVAQTTSLPKPSVSKTRVQKAKPSATSTSEAGAGYQRPLYGFFGLPSREVPRVLPSYMARIIPELRPREIVLRF